jgi:hypothetical protein
MDEAARWAKVEVGKRGRRRGQWVAGAAITDLHRQAALITTARTKTKKTYFSRLSRKVGVSTSVRKQRECEVVMDMQSATLS